MPRSLTDPFFVAEQARFAAGNAGRSADDIEYLRAFFKESGVQLDDCQIVSATYLAWYEALTQSGVRFEEHAGKLDRSACKMSEVLWEKFASQKENAVRARVAYAGEEERKAKNLMLAGGGGIGIVAIAIAWVMFRRRSQASEDKRSSVARDA